jgi:O-antigen ligase
VRRLGTASRDVIAPVAALTIVAFASGSSSVPRVTDVGSKARWLLLFVLLGVGVVLASSRSERLVLTRWALLFGGLVAAFAGLALISATWALAPRLSFERAASICVLFATVAAVSCGVAGERGTTRRLLIGLVAGGLTVAVLGLALLVFAYDDAVQSSGGVTPWRFRGFGMNPNTSPMLLAVLIVPAAWLAYSSSQKFGRIGWSLAAFAFYAEMVLSESRGAQLAAFAALVVLIAALVPGWRGKTVAVLLVAAAFGGGISLRQIEQGPGPSSAALPAPPPITSLSFAGLTNCRTARCRELAALVRRVRREFPEFRGRVGVLPQDEIGNPVFSDVLQTAGSGRIAAWEGALRQASDSPLLGYGFGNESKVFVDRWYYFQGSRPENSYIGLLLELGLAGLLLVLAIVLTAALPALRALPRTAHETRGIVAVCLGMVVAGLLLMLAQSYIYSVGNIATLSVWLALFVLVASTVATGASNAARDRRVKARPAVRLALGASAALVVVAALVVAAGRWERDRYAHGQADHLRTLYADAGGVFASSSLAAYRPGSPDCLWYVVGKNPYALSLCFDQAGRLVAGSDRRSGSPRYWSIEPVPSAASVRVDPRAVARLFRTFDRVLGAR